MICDARSLDDGTVLRAHVCVVGAGAAGIAVALQLAGSGRTVLLLEGGGGRAERRSQALYEGETADERLHPPPVAYRQRRFGGTTTIWSGRCVPFDAIDFERRDWMPDSGWPFGLEELRPHYVEANRLCEAGVFAYTAGAAFPRGMRPMLPGFAGRRFTDDTLERFSPPTDFAARYRRRLERGRDVQVLLHANVTDIVTNGDGGRVERLEIRTLGGRRIGVRADDFVLATGGLETARLLLAARGHHADGIGNAHDLVGRYYMCHLAGTVGRMAPAGGAMWHGYEVSADGVYCRRRLQITAAAQRELRVGNFVARLRHPPIGDPAHRTGILSALHLAGPLLGYARGEGAGAWRAHARNVALDPWDTLAFVQAWGRRRTFARRRLPSVVVRPKAGVYSLDVNAEQAPNRESRVRLTGALDALGMPRLRVEWRHSRADIDTVRRAVRALAEDLSAGGCGTLRWDDAEVEADILRDGAFGGHHLGTARMASSPRHGVVDPECAVHGVANLHLAGGAVFPTSSHANPTLTIVALAVRLGRRLAQPKVLMQSASANVPRGQLVADGAVRGN